MRFTPLTALLVVALSSYQSCSGFHFQPLPTTKCGIHSYHRSAEAAAAAAVSSSALSAENNHHDHDHDHEPVFIDRRSAIVSSLITAASSALLLDPSNANAATTATTTTTTTETTTLPLPPPPSSSKPPSYKILAPITQKVAFDIRISRQDGTFYVRDDLDQSLPENRVFYGTLTFGLFGTVAPKSVQRFLTYVDVATPTSADDNPLPSYSRSSFVRMDQATGLLTGGNIPSLEVTSFSGSTALKYGGRVLPAPLWIENADAPKLTHHAKGLLTHKTLDASPAFHLTTRTATSTPELDATHTVFGQLLLYNDDDTIDSSSIEFLRIVQDLPVYGADRPRSSDNDNNAAVEELASAVYTTQREFMRSAAKSFGDTRANKIYPGKLLRRVEVTSVRKLEV